MKRSYYIRLDVIRIIACALVLFYHLNILKGGYLAVCTFFVLSGYLSCKGVLKYRNFSLKRYYKDRFKKIYIPLLIIVFITVIFSKTFNISWLNLKQETTSVLFGYNNYWQLGANLDYFTRHVSSPFMHLWYIAILIQFDLIFPIIYKILKEIDNKLKNNNISTIIVSLLTLILTILFIYKSKTQDIMVVYYSTIARSFSIMFGVLFAILYHKNKINFSLKKYNKLIFVFYLLLFIFLNIVGDTNNYAIYMILTSIISVKLIAYSLVSKNNKNNKAISFISRGTYEVYLLQYPIIFFIDSININKNLKIFIIIILNISLAYVIHFIINKKFKYKIFRFIRTLIFILVVSYGSYLLILEKDHTKEMQELKNKLSNNLEQISAKNEEYTNSMKESEEKWNEVLSNMQDEEDKLKDIVTNLPVMGIGDSVMLGAINALYATFPNGYFDGKVSRSTVSAESLLADLRNSGKLGDILILALATNTVYTDRRIDNIMDIVENREVYWVNHVGGDDSTFNSKFAEYSKKYPNIHIVKWDEVSKGHPEYFYADGIHTKGSGTNAYANVIYDTIYNEYQKKLEEKKNKILEEHEKETKEKITFYGNDLLANVFDNIKNKYPKANFNVKNYTIDSLYKAIDKKIQNNMLEYKVVFMFDNNLNINKKDYIKLVNLCKNHEIYIINISKSEINIDGVKTINFYTDIKNNSDYMMADGVHLTEKGNIALINKINKEI